MRTFDPGQHPIPFVHQLLLSGVAPRPIALVSSIDVEGRINLSPFSFFNAFGANPPIVAISPAFRGTDGTPKHTYMNIVATGEFTVSAVDYSMLQQINLASSDYPAGVDEFVKAGFSPLPSGLVTPPGVAESPFVMECKLLHVYETSGLPASGNLLIGEVVRFHVRESAFTDDRIDPHKLDLIARMGYNWYCRAQGEALFELPKPRGVGVGVDALPEHIRNSSAFTGSDLALFGSLEALPEIAGLYQEWRRELNTIPASEDHLESAALSAAPETMLEAVQRDLKYGSIPAAELCMRLERCAREFLRHGNLDRAVFCAFVSSPDSIDAVRNMCR